MIRLFCCLAALLCVGKNKNESLAIVSRKLGM